MGNTSSQPAAPGTQLMHHVDSSRPASLVGSDARVPSPPTVAPVARLIDDEVVKKSPQSSKKRRRTASTSKEEAEPAKSKRRRGSEARSNKVPRGRPRDPSQLKPEIRSQPTETRGDDKCPSLRPPVTQKGRKLSKADEHMLEIARDMLPGRDDRASAQLEDGLKNALSAQSAEEARKGSQRSTRIAMTRSETQSGCATQSQGILGEDVAPTTRSSRIVKDLTVRRPVYGDVSFGAPERETQQSLRQRSKEEAGSPVTLDTHSTGTRAKRQRKQESVAVHLDDTLARVGDEAGEVADVIWSAEKPSTQTKRAVVAPKASSIEARNETQDVSAPGIEKDAVGEPDVPKQGKKRKKRKRNKRAGNNLATEAAFLEPSNAAMNTTVIQTGIDHSEEPMPDTRSSKKRKRKRKRSTALAETAPLALETSRTRSEEQTDKACQLPVKGTNIHDSSLKNTGVNESGRGIHGQQGPQCSQTHDASDRAHNIVTVPHPQPNFLKQYRDTSSRVPTAKRNSADGPQVSAPRMPTPSKSPHDEVQYGVDATKQVIGWLDDHDRNVADPNILLTSERIAAKRDDGNDDDCSDIVPEPENGVPASRIPDARLTAGGPNINRSEKVGLPAPISDGPKSGAFTLAEKATADAVFDYVSQKCDMTAWDLKASFLDWTNVGAFKLEIQDAFPNRTKAAVRKFCQRRYTCEDTGPWTAEQDEALLRARVEYHNNWMEISDLVNRTGQACRDRYIHHLQFGDKKVTGPWSQREEEKLHSAVEEAIEIVRNEALSKKDTSLANDRSRLDEMVNWTTVSNSLGGKRSSKRCREKWRQIEHRNIESIPDKDLDADSKPEVAPFNDQSIKQKAAEGKLKQFRYGDYYDVLVEILTAVKNDDQLFKDESTLWSIVALRHKNSKFSGALRRGAYYAAVKNYASLAGVIGATTIVGKARAMARFMEQWQEKHDFDVFKRGYHPVVLSAEQKAERKARKRAAAKKERKEVKSAEYVGDSDGCDREPGPRPEAAKGAKPKADDEVSIADTYADHNAGRVAEDDVQLSEDGFDGVTVVSMNSRWERSKPKVNPGAFVARCKDAGKGQQGRYCRPPGHRE